METEETKDTGDLDSRANRTEDCIDGIKTVWWCDGFGADSV